jgi:hypothetical protein
LSGQGEASVTVANGEADRRRIANQRRRRRLTSRNRARLVFYEHGASEKTPLYANPIIYGLEIFQPVLGQLRQEFKVSLSALTREGVERPPAAGEGLASRPGKPWTQEAMGTAMRQGAPSDHCRDRCH